MKSLKIGLDVDGVIVDYAYAMLPLLSDACKRPVSYDELRHWDLTKALALNEQDLELVWERLFDHTLLRDMPPVAGALEGTKALSHHEIWIITGRPVLTQPATEAWFARHGVRYDHIVFDRHADKHEIVNGFDVFVEDSLENAVIAAERGIFTLLFDRPWNQAESLPARCQRVYGWGAIVSLIKQLEEY